MMGAVAPRKLPIPAGLIRRFCLSAVLLPAVLLVGGAPGAVGCFGLALPVEGPVVARFAPIGRYAGHWGVDVAAPVGTPVRAAAAGIVSFAGPVAGRLSVTIDHGGGLRTSYSYLNELRVRRGARVVTAMVVGSTGRAHGAALHLSLRIGGGYVDPLPWFRCLSRPYPALRLASSIYDSRRAAWHPRRNLRSSSPGPPGGG